MKKEAASPEFEGKSGKRIEGVSYVVLLVTTALGILLSVNQLFQLKLFGFFPIGSGYFYYILAFFLSISFLIFPARSKDARTVPWYDWVLYILCMGVNGYFAFHSYEILMAAWEYKAPTPALILSYVLWALALEAVRRAAGFALFIICFIFSFYPVFGQYLSGMLWGTPFTLNETASFHALGVESIIGIATRVVGNDIIGYILFGAAVVASGGGKFFMDFALSLLGKSRGGAAKVAIVSSAFMASLSGSVVSNIVTTGTLTIPAMKKTGYSAKYAAAIEACASTGGTITPPIMGAAGFLIASFLNIPYSQVMLAVIFPAFLYFFVLFLQADFHAAKMNIEGLSEEELPDTKEVLKTGWMFLAAICFMIYLLLVYRITALAPFYTILFLFVCSMFRKETRLNWEKLKNFIYEGGVVVGHITAVLAGIGLVVGAFSATGVANSFSRELLIFAGESIFLLLILGACTSFVLGIGMTVTACYVFLAVVLAPALVAVGLDPLACHLFVMFCGNLSYITPPVALGSISAAAISGSHPMATGFTCMRLGVVLFFIPFVFVLNPALIFHGEPLDIVLSIAVALAGSFFLASAFEGWTFGLGHLSIITRVFLFVGGICFIYPNWMADVVGLTFALLGVIMAKVWPVVKKEASYSSI